MPYYNQPHFAAQEIQSEVIVGLAFSNSLDQSHSGKVIPLKPINCYADITIQ